MRLVPLSDATFLTVYRDVGRKALNDKQWKQAEMLFTRALASLPARNDRR